MKTLRHILRMCGHEFTRSRPGICWESDLLGLNYPLTASPARQYQPPPVTQTVMHRKSTKGSVSINVEPRHLPAIQMWSYQATFAPIPMNVKQCGRPEKY